jgi:transposase
MARRTFRAQKVVTINELADLLQCSVSTARRRLKQWKTHTSYNRNGRYYVLPDVVRFDTDGLWRYRGIGFSRYGNLTQTVIHLVHNSKAGLRAAELGRLLGLEPRSFLSAFRDHAALRREKHRGRFVYFAADSDLFREQRQRRMAMGREAELPSDAEAVAILVERIKQPRSSVEELVVRLKAQSVRVSAQAVRNLFARHGLTGKKTPLSRP